MDTKKEAWILKLQRWEGHGCCWSQVTCKELNAPLLFKVFRPPLDREVLEGGAMSWFDIVVQHPAQLLGLC